MSKTYKTIFITIALIAITCFVLLFFQKDNQKNNIKNEKTELVEAEQKKEEIDIIQEDVEIEKNNEEKIVKNVVLEVPFVLQAPFANWSDPLFEDACEEAAVLMAKGWVGEETFTSQQAFDEIKKIAELEKEILGEYIDSSAEDTAEILKKYSGIRDVEVVKNVSIEDIISEISKGNLIIVPTNGRKLGNPNYTAPGPITHMIVIIGYDSAEKEFITNDSGTRNGKGYRYKQEVLFEAIRNYPTGNHYKNPISESNPEKTMIIVEK